MAERIRHIVDNEKKLVMRFDSVSADAVYALIMWMEGWQEDRHQIPGAWELTMAYRSAKIELNEATKILKKK